MTLDEAIKHAEEVAGSHDRIKQIKAVTLEECKCAEEHRRLAEWLKDYKRLIEQNPCEDCISRSEAIKMFKYNYKGERIPDYDCDNFPVQIAIKTVKEMLRGLPPVTPQPKQRAGRWIDEFGGCKCSECGCLEAGYSDYCPNCGIKMEVQDADSD